MASARCVPDIRTFGIAAHRLIFQRVGCTAFLYRVTAKQGGIVEMLVLSGD